MGGSAPMTATPDETARAREIAGICENSAVGDCGDSQRKCDACIRAREIREAISAAKAEERERCAKVVETLAEESCPHLIDESCCNPALRKAAAEIRATVTP